MSENKGGGGACREAHVYIIAKGRERSYLLSQLELLVVPLIATFWSERYWSLQQRRPLRVLVVVTCVVSVVTLVVTSS